MGFHQGLLGDVGGIVGRATDHRGKSQGGGLIPPDKRAKGSVVTGAGAGDEISVRGFC